MTANVCEPTIDERFQAIIAECLARLKSGKSADEYISYDYWRIGLLVDDLMKTEAPIPPRTTQ